MAIKLEDIKAANMYASDIKNLTGVKLKWTEVLQLAHLQKEHSMEAMFMVLQDNYGLDVFSLNDANGNSSMGDESFIKYCQKYHPSWRKELV